MVFEQEKKVEKFTKPRMSIIKKKIIPLRVIYKQHADKIKNKDYMLANKRLKRYRRNVESKQKLISSLFYDPFKPLDLNSRVLTENEKKKRDEPVIANTILKRQDQLDPQFEMSRNRTPMRANMSQQVMPKLYFRETHEEQGKFDFYLDILYPY